MLIRDLRDCQPIIAPDGAEIRELLHPGQENTDLRLDYSLAYAIVKPGEATLPHRLKTSSEVYYILRGCGLMHIAEETEKVLPGQVIYVPPNVKQSIENPETSNLEYLVIVYPAWHANDPEIL